jgi:hypothetical protein
MKYCTIVFSSVRNTLLAALQHVADDATATRLNKLSVEPKLIVLGKATRKKLDELLQPHGNGHPITYNHYLTDNVQKAQRDRNDRKVRSVLEKYADSSSKSTKTWLQKK